MAHLAHRYWRPLLALLALSTGLMTLWGLRSGQRSEYYAAIAVSMSHDWSNWLFGALDPAGTVTLDKIPGSYWIPALFVKVFGFSTWAVDAPNALATVATVVVVARTFKRHWGAPVGLIAGLAVATTPILIAVGRSNQPQSFFVLTLALAMDRAIAALVTHRRRTLVAAGVWIGVAFQMYMLEAWAVWPALIVAWLATKGSWRRKVIDLLAAGATSLAVSLAWVTVAWLTPAGSRPYIGGTYKNNPWEMVFGYNGLGRFSATSSALSSTTSDPAFRSFTPPFGGPAGFGRLFSTAVAGQIAWLLPAAVVAAIILWFGRRQRPVTIFLGLWLATFAAMFSLVAGIHQFYTSSLALPAAGLIALVFAMRETRAQLLIAAVAAASGIWVSWMYTGYMSWAPLISLVAAAFLAVAVLVPDLQAPRSVIVPFALVAILFTPAAWSADARNHPSSINPIAGPAGYSNGPGGMGGGMPIGTSPNGQADGAMGGGGPGGASYSADLVTYLRANRDGAQYLVATAGAQAAAPYITATGENVLPIGGFDGQDPVPTLEQFTALVKAGDVRFVLGGQQGGGPNRQANSEIATWVQSNCAVDSGAPSGITLYRCGS